MDIVLGNKTWTMPGKWRMIAVHLWRRWNDGQNLQGVIIRNGGENLRGTRGALTDRNVTWRETFVCTRVNFINAPAFGD